MISQSNWKYSSPDTPGFHTVVTPENSACVCTWMFRLNLQDKKEHHLYDNSLELSVGVIDGSVEVTVDSRSYTLSKLDSFYIPSKRKATIVSRGASICYIGGSICEGVGDFFVRKYDPELPLGEIRQIHGTPPYRRSVFMAVNQEMPASRLITGFTIGDDGAWTSWPPHQHEKDLEEIYAYFDIPSPKFALHVGYETPGAPDRIYPVSSGDCVIIPRGYHPTMAMPGVRSAYFWVMAAFSHKSRSYELAVPDPAFD
ncbi:MAG: myo-inositol catabolism protein [Chitinivibrionales bacterium]|nr:myo-inositol catabolism protein [Chitinivibrionales bacterium]